MMVWTVILLKFFIFVEKSIETNNEVNSDKNSQICNGLKGEFINFNQYYENLRKKYIFKKSKKEFFISYLCYILDTHLNGLTESFNSKINEKDYLKYMKEQIKKEVKENSLISKKWDVEAPKLLGFAQAYISSLEESRPHDEDESTSEEEESDTEEEIRRESSEENPCKRCVNKLCGCFLFLFDRLL